MDVKKVSTNELKRVVEIHENSFKDFFLTTLGSGFLKDYYSILLKDENTTFIGCYIEGNLEGFCSVANYSKKYNTKLIKSNLSLFFMMGIKVLLKKPISLIRLAKNLDKNTSTDNGDYAEILSIAVSPNAQGKGAGKKMLFYLENILKDKTVEKLSLTTDYNNNNYTINFYKKSGYKVLSEFITYPDRKMYRFIKEI